MNKKIFTLLASSLMLFLTAIVMNAQGYYGSEVQKLPTGQGKGAYHLKVSSIGDPANGGWADYSAPDADAPLLSLGDDGMLKLVMSSSLVGADYEDLNAALWCVNVSKPEKTGKFPVYQFTNKQFESLLAVDTGRMVLANGSDSYNWLATDQTNFPIQFQLTNKKDAVYAKGQFADWGFSKDYEKNLSPAQPLLIEVPGKPGWFLTFAAPADGRIHLVMVYWDDINPDNASDFYNQALVRFTLVKAAPRVLTAKDFNTSLGKNPDGKTAQLIFTPDVLSKDYTNVLANQLHAVESDNNGTLLPYNENYYMNFNNNASAPKDVRWVYVADGDDAKNYYNNLNTLYPIIKNDSKGIPVTDNYNYDFRLVYYPSEDSVVMNVRGLQHIDMKYGYNSDGYVEDPGLYTLGDNELFNIEILNFLTVRMQDLTSVLGERVITVKNDPAQTRIHFGNNTCTVSDDRITVPRDLYVIRDSQNRYLVMPLETGDFTPRWMELRENEDPMKTPSYQWLVYPMNENSPTSPIMLVNREFNWVVIQAAQIYKTAPGKAFNGTVNWLYTPANQQPNADYNLVTGAIVYYPDKASTDTYLDIAHKGLKWDIKDGWNGSFLKVQDDLKAAAKVATKKALTQDEMQKLHRTSPYIGYKYIAEDTLSYYTYAFNYLHKFSPDYYLGLNQENNPNDTTVYVTHRKNYFSLELTQELINYGTEKYGIGWADKFLDDPATADIAPLERYYYHFKENDYWNFLFTDKYVVIDDNGRYGFTDTYTANTRPRQAGVFYLRFTYQPQGQPEYYAMVERLQAATLKHYEEVLGLQIVQELKKLDQTHDGLWEVSAKDSLGVMLLGIDQMNLYARTQVKAVGATTVSTFAIDNSLEPLYRRFNVESLDGAAPAGKPEDNPRVVKIYRTNSVDSRGPAEYLYENQVGRNAEKSCINCPPYDQTLANGINFLAVENIYDHAVAGPEHAALGHNYAIYLDTAYVNRGTGWIKPQYLLVLGPQINEEWYCTDCNTLKGDYVYGRYLINATDSARFKNAAGKAIFGPNAAIRDAAYIWDSTWERLAFVPAIHIRDTLFILNGHDLKEFFYPIPDTNEEGLHMSLLRKAANDPKNTVTAIPLGDNYHKDVVFSMRFIAQGDKENFLLESETTRRGLNPMIAPMNGGWVKIQNNELVISRGSYVDAVREAEKWNTEVTTDPPVANDQVAVTAVKVIAGQGNVSILNAAGKKVTVSNILGQTVASAVLTSDNATLNAPKGVLVVAVEGENAVKAVVK